MIKGTVCLFVACLGVILLSLPAVAVPTVYEYMTGAGFGSGTIASIEGTEIFESQSSTGILKAAVDFAVFSPDVYGSDIEIVPAAYWESGLSPDSDNYLYAYRREHIHRL